MEDILVFYTKICIDLDPIRDLAITCFMAQIVSAASFNILNSLYNLLYKIYCYHKVLNYNFVNYFLKYKNQQCKKYKRLNKLY